MTQTDVMTMARFLVLPGAADLLDAFSRIPPGRLRESAVLHVQAIAETYSEAPASQHMPDPLLMAAQAAEPLRPVAPALDSPKPKAKTNDPKVKAIELLLQGKPVHIVAEKMGLSISDVLDAKREGAKAGLIYPKEVKRKKHNRFPLHLSDFNQRGLGVANEAAKRRGLDLETYVERRRMTVEMAQEGRHILAIIEAVKEDEKSVRGWISQARAGGHHIPYMLSDPAPNVVPPEPEPEPAPTAEVIDLKPHRKANDPHQGRFLLYMDQLDEVNRGGIDRGAELMGVPVEEFLRRRREALILFGQKKSAGYVAKAVGISHKQAVNWRGRAQRAGVLDLVRPSRVKPSRQKTAAEKLNGQAPLRAAALALGLTVDAYLAKRTEALALFDEGLTGPQIAERTGIDVKKLYNWRTWSTQQAAKAARG